MTITSQATNSQSASKTTPTSSSLFSSFTSSFASNKTAADLGKRFNTFSQTLQQHARDLPKNISRLPDQLDSEHQQFVKSKTNDEKQLIQKHSEYVMPWEGYENYEQELKRRILEITKDERNFILPPPDDTTFEFDMKAYSQSARAILTQDKALSHMRFLLVPQKVTETDFWRNYFYRVVTVKKAVLSDGPLSHDSNPISEKDDKKQKKSDVLFDFTADSDDGDDDDNDVYDDAKNNMEKVDEQMNQNITTIDQKSSKDTSNKITKTEPHNDDDEMEEWERELRRAAAEGL